MIHSLPSLVWDGQWPSEVGRICVIHSLPSLVWDGQWPSEVGRMCDPFITFSSLRWPMAEWGGRMCDPFITFSSLRWPMAEWSWEDMCDFLVCDGYNCQLRLGGYLIHLVEMANGRVRLGAYVWSIHFLLYSLWYIANVKWDWGDMWFSIFSIDCDGDDVQVRLAVCDSWYYRVKCL